MVSKRTGRSRALWFLLAAGGLLGLVGIAAGVAFYLTILRDLPDLDRIEDYRPPLASVVTDRHGERHVGMRSAHGAVGSHRGEQPREPERENGPAEDLGRRHPAGHSLRDTPAMDLCQVGDECSEPAEGRGDQADDDEAQERQQLVAGHYGTHRSPIGVIVSSWVQPRGD